MMQSSTTSDIDLSPHPPLTGSGNVARSGRLIARRVIPGILFFCSVGLLVVAALLEPSDKGFGTHEKLGLAPCGMIQMTGMPCVTCGMTTSFAYAADGQLWQSFVNQPAGAILAILTAMLAIVSGYAFIVGVSLAPLGQALLKMRTVWLAGAILIGAWIYKIMMVRGTL